MMILIKLSEAIFEYDIHSLVKAFFPHEKVVVTAENKEFAESVRCRGEVFYEPGGGVPDAIRFVFSGEEKRFHSLCQQVDLANRQETKNKLKRLIYQQLEYFTQTTLPWGTLTGIRPTKIALQFLEAGKSKQWISDYMAKNYFTSAEKVQLCYEIAQRERSILQQFDYQQGYSLYIGIPFCPSTCFYCSFTSYPIGSATQVEDYLAALEKEMAAGTKAFCNKNLDTVYVGGGTPTALSERQLERLLSSIHRYFDLSSLKEFTVEAGRPDSITIGKLKLLKAFGVSRISINPQTMQHLTLQRIGRHHTPEQIRESFLEARALGFDHINMDLIIGLPQETLADVRDTMEQIKMLAPDSITVHALAVKRGSRLAALEPTNLSAEKRRLSTNEDPAKSIALTAAYASEMGLSPYYLYRQKNITGNFENVGYAKPDKAGIYNILMMEDKQTILALGAGTISKFITAAGQKAKRTENVKDLAQYLTRLDEMIMRRQTVIENCRSITAAE
jgi:oxygen-independent coproporphyrinogen-3 oxidase